MHASLVQTSSRTVAPGIVALRVFGTIGSLFAVLVGVVLIARPEMMMAAMHAAVSLVFVP